MPPESSAGNLQVLGCEPDHFELGERHFVHQPLRQFEILAHRELHVLAHGERGEERALLKQNAPAAFERAPLAFACFGEIDAEHLDRTLAARQEPDDGAQQHRFARARSADDAKDLGGSHIEGKMVEHDLVAEADDEVAHLDDRSLRHRHIPIEAKKIANRPSSTITRKIDWTTEAVVKTEGFGAALHAEPSAQATTPMTSPMNGALIMPTLKWVSEIASVRRER